MPRLHFPDQALVRRLVEAAVKSSMPVMLAHDHGLYLCHDDIKEPDGHCVCAFVDGCDPDIDPEAHETANALVGFDDFGISLPLCGEQSLLDDLKNGHRLAIAFGRRAVTILTQAPATKQSQPTPAARGRGDESHRTARDRSNDMTTTATKRKTSTKSKATKSDSKSGERLRKAVIAEIGERIARLDGAPMANGKAATTKQTKAAPTKARKENKAPKAKRTSALDAAAQVLAGAKEPMSAGDLIDAMAKRDLWKSPGGKTPHATLYAAIIREIRAKGEDARFRKTDRGMFVATNGEQG